MAGHSKCPSTQELVKNGDATLFVSSLKYYKDAVKIKNDLKTKDKTLEPLDE